MSAYYRFHVLKKISILILVVFGGCREVVQDKIQNTNQYFDLKGLLEEQIILLDSLRPSVKKTTYIDAVEETQSFQLDSTGWAREMEIFFEVDINDPILKDAYQIKEKSHEDSLRSVLYEAKALDNTEIKFLEVIYLSETDIPRYIRAVFAEKNALYDSRRSLKLEFQKYKDLNILSGYSIEGAQKMLLKDTILYKVQVRNSF